MVARGVSAIVIGHEFRKAYEERALSRARRGRRMELQATEFAAHLCEDLGGRLQVALPPTEFENRRAYSWIQHGALCVNNVYSAALDSQTRHRSADVI